MPGSYESKRFSSGSLDRETSFNESSFDGLLSDEDMGGDHTISSTHASYLVVKDLASTVVITPEMEIATLSNWRSRPKTYNMING